MLQLRCVIDLIGAEHMDLGLDYVFDRTELVEHVRRNPPPFPPGIAGGLEMVDPEALRAITEGLVRANLTDAQIRGILGRTGCESPRGYGSSVKR